MAKNRRKVEKIPFGGVYVVPEVLQSRRESGLEKHIICDIGHYTSKGHEYRYKFAQMAVKFGVSRKAVLNAVARLKAAGKVFDTGQDDYHHNLHLNQSLSAFFGKTGQLIEETVEQPEKAKKTYPENSDEYRLAKLLDDEIRKRKPDFKKPNLQSWARHIDLMLTRDQRSPEQIERVIRWAQADNGNGTGWGGWQNNILSTAKLRQKFDKLELCLGEDNGRTSKTRQGCRAGYPGIR